MEGLGLRLDQGLRIDHAWTVLVRVLALECHAYLLGHSYRCNIAMRDETHEPI
jgi:hypothetical protein